MATYSKHEALQYLFNKAFAHIIEQGKPCLSYETMEPMLVNENDPRIKDTSAIFIKEYDIGMEGELFATLVRKYPAETFDSVAAEYPYFVEELQEVHDSLATECTDSETFISLFRVDMMELANDNGLTCYPT